ncbi:MAG: hypothetical protein IKP48_00640 [Bacteroidaceae bacterium]|nr:hypothetical protein [Bacteroidaceae bacterium]
MNKRINIYEEANRCLLCQDPPCSKACKTGDPARAIRAIRFDNHKPALQWVKQCSDADLERAEQACIHYNWPIHIKEIIRSISPDDVDNSHYPDLNITFCGIQCENPFFVCFLSMSRHTNRNKNYPNKDYKYISHILILLLISKGSEN